MAQSPAPFLQGTLDLIALQLLRAEPTNGYDLTLRIQAVSSDVLQVNAGSLYPRCTASRSAGWSGPNGRKRPTAGKAKVYSVTAAGRRQLVEQRETWAQSPVRWPPS